MNEVSYAGTSCWVILHTFLLSADFIFEFQAYHWYVKHLDPDQAQHVVESDLGPDSLQRLARVTKVNIGSIVLSARVLDSRPRGPGFEPHW